MIIATPPGLIDWRIQINSNAFSPEGDKEWIMAAIESPFPFDELIYSWKTPLPEGEGFRLYLQVQFEKNDLSPWIYGGYWGKVHPSEKREEPDFDRGHMAMDQLLLKTKARAFQFKVVSEGDKPLSAPPVLIVMATDNTAPENLMNQYSRPTPNAMKEDLIFDLPLRRQIDSKGAPLPNRCQSAALATAMEYYGKSVNMEDILPLTFDPEYNYPGIWPRTLGAAVQFGFDAYIDRFRTWEDVRKALDENKVILASIKMPESDDYKAPPYSSIGGHIVAINGLTSDGRVVVTDSALGKSGRGYCCQWYCEDFEKVWMRTKGGVGMVVCPPSGFTPKRIQDLPPFPTEERKRWKEENWERTP